MPGLDGSVLHLIAPAPDGGAESVVRALARASHDRPGHRAHVVALMSRPGPHPFVELLRADGVPVTEVRCGPRRYLAEVLAVARVLRESGASLVHTHVYHADVIGYVAARRCGIPVVATVHGFTANGWKNAFYIWLDLRLLRRFDAVICVSEAVRTRVLRSGVPGARAHVVPNAYAASRPVPRSEARARLGVGEHDVVIGWVGRFTRDKGPDLFLDAVLGLERPRTVALLVGDGPERDVLAARVAGATSCACDVRLLGRQDDAGSLLAAFDVLVMSSRSEGVPMVLLEAITAEVPVVSFAVGGIPEVLSDDAGFLVPAGDVASLRRAIAWSLEHPEEGRRRCRVAKGILTDRLGAQRWLDGLESVYRAARRS